MSRSIYLCHIHGHRPDLDLFLLLKIGVIIGYPRTRLAQVFITVVGRSLSRGAVSRGIGTAFSDLVALDVEYDWQRYERHCDAAEQGSSPVRR